MNNELLLQSKNDIPFIEANLNIHNPTLNEISLIGEEAFHSGCQLLTLTKNSLKVQDKSVLEGLSDFEILMTIMCDKEYSKHKNYVISLFALLLPDYQIRFTENEILLVSNSNSARINKENYETFKDILVSMFNLKSSSEEEYNPLSSRAEKIAEKLKKGKEKANQIKSKGKNDNKKISIYSRYVSILSVGERKDMNLLMEYTPYQLMDEFTRFQMKEASDLNIQAKMAGATGLDEVDNWMNDIHS